MANITFNEDTLHAFPARSCLALALLAAAACSHPSDCGSIDRMVATTYRFHPAKLDSAHIAEKSRAMDAFWDTVRARPATSLPCLRAAIQRDTSDTFFGFDGSALLVSLDSSRADEQLQLTAAGRVDLGDLALADWVHLVAHRAVQGFNTVTVAARWLALPDSAATYYLPQHSYRASKADGALFLFGSLPESLATPCLASVARSDSGQRREIAVWLLVHQATPAARDVLRSLAPASLSPETQRGLSDYLANQPATASQRKPAVSREEFLSAFRALHSGNVDPFLALVTKVPDGEKDAAVVLLPEDLPEVRFARRYLAAAATPEAVAYYMDFTGILEAVMARPSR